jgi:hypothetical protein
MIVWSIMIIINFVLTLLVSTACLSHDREPARNKGCVQPHLLASYLHLRVGRVGGYTAGGFPSNPIPVRVCAEQVPNSKSEPKKFSRLCTFNQTYLLYTIEI